MIINSFNEKNPKINACNSKNNYISVNASKVIEKEELMRSKKFNKNYTNASSLHDKHSAVQSPGQ